MAVREGLRSIWEVSWIRGGKLNKGGKLDEGGRDCAVVLMRLQVSVEGTFDKHRDYLRQSMRLLLIVTSLNMNAYSRKAALDSTCQEHEKSFSI